MTEGKKQFFKDLTDIRESKVSALMLFFIPTMIIGLVLAILRGDVPDNLTFIIMTMIGGISGVNIFTAKKNQSMNMGNMQQGSYNNFGYGGYSGYGNYNPYNYNNYADGEGI